MFGIHAAPWFYLGKRRASELLRTGSPVIFASFDFSELEHIAGSYLWIILGMANRFFNKAEDVVTECIEGLVASYSHLQRLDGFPQVYMLPANSFTGGLAMAMP